MRRADKNVTIGIMIAIIGIFAWSVARYTSIKKLSNTDEQNTDTGLIQNVDQDRTSDASIESTTSPIQTVIPLISAQELLAKISAEKETLMIIDTRSHETFASAHIKGSYHVDDARLTTLTSTTILVTETGAEDPVIDLYREISNGTTVMNLQGGMREWLQSGYPLISLVNEPNFVNASKVQYLEPRDVDALIKSAHDPFVIIDTRRSGNFLQGHVSGAINIPLSELEYRVNELPHNIQLIVYGANELASFQSGALLYDLNYPNTKTIKGGFEAWEKYGYAIMK